MIQRNKALWLDVASHMTSFNPSRAVYFIGVCYNGILKSSQTSANNLVFWCRFLNKLERWHIVYIMQQ